MDERHAERNRESQLVAVVQARIVQVHEQTQGAGEQIDRFVMGALPRRLVAGHGEIIKRAQVILARLEMRRQFAGDFRCTGAPGTLLAQADAVVQPYSSARCDTEIEHVLVERVDEAVVAGARAVRPAQTAACADELRAARERRTGLLDGVKVIAIEASRDRGRRELAARDCGDFEDTLLLRTETIDLLFNHLPHAVGNVVQHRVRQAAEAERRDVVGDVHHEQWMAFSAPMHDRRELSDGWHCGCIREASRQVFADCRFRQAGQGQLQALPARFKFLLHRLERMIACVHFHGTEGSQDHETSGFTTLRDEGHQIQRRVITPMQVFKHQHQWPRRAQHLKCLGHLAQHALARRAERAPCQACQRCAVQHGWKLHQPGRCVLFKHVDEGVVILLACQTAERVEHRHIGFARAVLFDALATSDTRRRGVRHSVEQRTAKAIHNRGLANAGLASDKHHLAGAGCSQCIRRSESREFGSATDRLSGQPEATATLRCVGKRRTRCVRRTHHEAIATAMYGFNEARFLGVIAQHAAQFTHQFAQAPFGDDAAGPQRVEQVILGEQFAGTGSELLQQREGLGAQGERLVSLFESGGTEVDPERRKRKVEHGVHVGGHQSLRII